MGLFGTVQLVTSVWQGPFGAELFWRLPLALICLVTLPKICFANNNVGRFQRQTDGRRPPIFPMEMWNCYRRTISGEDRTNNHTSTAHRILYAELWINHRATWKVIVCIRKIHKGREADNQPLTAGKGPSQTPVNTLKVEELIVKIINRIVNRPHVEARTRNHKAKPGPSPTNVFKARFRPEGRIYWVSQDIPYLRRELLMNK